MKPSDIYFKVVGITDNGTIDLGYTSCPKAWLMNSNGWKLSQLIFYPLLKKREGKKNINNCDCK